MFPNKTLSENKFKQKKNQEYAYAGIFDKFYLSLQNENGLYQSENLQ